MNKSKGINKDLWQLLVQKAKEKKTITYTEVSKIIGLSTPRI
jgi:hypothetical protein